MHYFKMNIGDYAKKAGRLSMLEHGAYTLLIHSCYDRERFPTLDEAFDWCWARSEEERSAVAFILNKFFDLEGVVYIQRRIQEEIDKYQENSHTNKRIAREREDKRRAEKERSVHEACSSVNEPPPNQEPLTKNQEPLTKNQEDKEKSCALRFDEFWKLYPNAAAKKKCEEKWKKNKLDEIADLIIDDVRRKSNSVDWLKEGGKYIPMSITYINQERWNDTKAIQEKAGRGLVV